MSVEKLAVSLAALKVEHLVVQLVGNLDYLMVDLLAA
jgi:hypothetical protein